MFQFPSLATFIFQNPSQAITSLPWYQVAGGILALPAAIVGIWYAVLLGQKVRLECQKTRLEIIEKARSLNFDSNTLLPIASDIPGAESANIYFVGSLILRFILYRLVIEVWNFIHLPIGWLLMAFQGGLMYLAAKEVSVKLLGIGWGVLWALDMIFSTVVYWVIFFSIAWPIFVDILGYFGIKIVRFRQIYAHARHWKLFTRKIRSTAVTDSPIDVPTPTE